MHAMRSNCVEVLHKTAEAFCVTGEGRNGEIIALSFLLLDFHQLMAFHPVLPTFIQ